MLVCIDVSTGQRYLVVPPHPTFQALSPSELLDCSPEMMCRLIQDGELSAEVRDQLSKAMAVAPTQPPVSPPGPAPGMSDGSSDGEVRQRSADRQAGHTNQSGSTAEEHGGQGGRADKSGTKKKKSKKFARSPATSNVCELAKRIAEAEYESEREGGRHRPSRNEIAIDYTEGDKKKADSLLRQLRPSRYGWQIERHRAYLTNRKHRK